jgi:hypothetical protein
MLCILFLFFETIIGSLKKKKLLLLRCDKWLWFNKNFCEDVLYPNFGLGPKAQY